MNENQEAVKTEVEESVSFDFDDDNNLSSQEVSVPEKNEETSTIVQESEDSSEDSELENYSENVQKRINQLTAKRKQAIEEAEAAYTYAQQVQQQNEEMKKRLSDLDRGYINEYGNRVESQELAVKKVMKDAYDAGDMDKVAEAQATMSQLAIDKERLRIQKARSERQSAQQEQVAQQPQQVPQQPRQLDQKLTSWMGKNPWFGEENDLVMTRGAQAIHEQIVAREGFDPNTDEYYQEIDRRMRKEFPHKFQEQRQNAQAVTPASSGRSATKSGRKKTVELTPGQVAFAKKMKIPLERYAKEVAKLERKQA